MKKTRIALAVSAALPLALAACTAVGPDYVRPAPLASKAALPAEFKEAAGWKRAEPRDHELRGKWWEIFGDSLLNGLEEQIDVSNQSLAQSQAQFRQALALVQAARSAYYPNVQGNLLDTRSQSSSTVATTTNPAPSGSAAKRPIATEHDLLARGSWEADVWGRIGRTVEASVAGAQASAADLGAARLSLQAALAQDYFQLRTLDEQAKLLEETLVGYEKSLHLSQNQFRAGTVSKADVAQAETQLQTTQAQLVDVGVQRAQLEHAIALLAGKPPAAFSIARAAFAAQPPAIPVALPSELLERRPDIAGAERRVVAANAQIGVTKAAYFPSLIFNATAGYQSASLAPWFNLPSRIWSLGPSIALTLFDGGLRAAQSAQAIAAYDASVAAYRQTVLGSFQQIEDDLAALRILEQEADVQQKAVQAARESVTLTTNQYKAGTVSYLNVVTVQTTQLSNERTAVDIRSRRLAAAVLLVRDLGGGWNT